MAEQFRRNADYWWFCLPYILKLVRGRFITFEYDRMVSTREWGSAPLPGSPWSDSDKQHSVNITTGC